MSYPRYRLQVLPDNYGIVEMLRPLELRHEMDAVERFKNKCVVVTGAGSGIGRATAIQFAQQGAKVLIADINEKRLTQL